MTDNKYFSESEWMDRYIKRPTFCPYCEADGVISHNIKPEYDFAWTVVECQECHKRWKEIYSLTAIEEIEDWQF